MKDKKKSNEKNITFVQSACSGTIAGILEPLLNHPLFTIKTRIQRGHASVWALRGMYHGMFSNMATMASLTALRISLSTAFQNKFFDSNNELSSYERITSALVGGCIPSLIGSPLELLRIQQQESKLNLLKVTENSIKKNGITFLSSGIIATATRDALYTSGFLAMVPIIKIKIKLYCDNELIATLTPGPLAGAFAAFTSQPFDTIRDYQQICAAKKRKISMKKATQEIINRHGFKGFFKAATPRILRVISGVTIISTINEKMTAYYEKKNSTREKDPKFTLKK